MLEALTEERVVPRLRATSKKDILRELAELACRVCPDCGSPDEISSLLSEREQIGSTAFGEGVAIPHGKLEQLDHIEIFFGRSLTGVPFAAVDNKPVHLFVLLLAPTESSGPYLKTLATLARLLKSSHIRSQLLHADSSQEIVRIFASAREFR